MRLDFHIPEVTAGYYAFRIGARARGGYEVQSEDCHVNSLKTAADEAHYRVRGGSVVSISNGTAMPVATTDRLYLVGASGIPAFRPVYDVFSRMAFYNLIPADIRDTQTTDAGELLTRYGDNIGSVLHWITDHSPNIKRRIEEYLATVVPGVVGVDARDFGPYEMLEFRQHVSGSKQPWRFPATSMSDGTLRALGVLVALFQGGNGTRVRIPLIGIEEPEVALHPAALGALLDSLDEASANKQIIITSHSPDLLDSDRIDPDSLLAVVADKGVTTIAPIDDAGRTVLRDHLYTAGELLRLNQLSPRRNGYKQHPHHPTENEE